jgi:hypothetical protein
MRLSQLLYREDKWAKNCMAVKKDGTKLYDLNVYHLPNGEQIDPSKDCVAYSLYGAIAHLYSNDGQQDVTTKLGNAVREYCKCKIWLSEFNNKPETTFQDIKKVLAMAKL